jgi:DNA-binding beta-propeller fold protein YncE
MITTIMPGGSGCCNNLILSPDGSLLYLAANPVEVMDTTSDSIIATIPTNCVPDRMARSSDGSQVYGFCSDGTVQVYNAASRTLTKTVPLDPGAVFGRLAASSDGKTLYVPSSSNKIFVLDADTLNLIQTILVKNPQAITVCTGCNT